MRFQNIWLISGKHLVKATPYYTLQANTFGAGGDAQNTSLCAILCSLCNTWSAWWLPGI